MWMGFLLPIEMGLFSILVSFPQKISEIHQDFDIFGDLIIVVSSMSLKMITDKGILKKRFPYKRTGFIYWAEHTRQFTNRGPAGILCF